MFCKPLGGSLVPPPCDVECWHHTLFWKAGKQFPWLACHFLLWVIIIDAWLDWCRLTWPAGRACTWKARAIYLPVLWVNAKPSQCGRPVGIDLIHQCRSWCLTTQVHVASWDGTPHHAQIGQRYQRRTAGRMMQGTALC